MEPGVRIGLMVPENNTTMERELAAWLPAGSGCSTLRIPRGRGTLTLEDIPAYVAKAVEMAAAFVDEPLDVVVYGCTAAGILAGPERDAQIAAALAGVAGKPAVTTARAMVERLTAMRARDIALLTPYLDAVNERLVAFLASAGIRVASLKSFGAATVEALAAIDAESVARHARETMRPGCDALFIACSQLPTADVIPALEGELQRPVWSSIRATAASALAARNRGQTPIPAT
jgi:maleate cis-trans isomerase